MNKNKTLKVMILIIAITLIASLCTTVFADDSILDFNTITGNTTGNTSGTDDVPDISPTKPANNTSTDNTVDNNTTVDNNIKINTVGNSTPTTNTNTSKYQESNIPYAGAESSILIAAAFVVCAIIGIYTFIKLSNYSNI